MPGVQLPAFQKLMDDMIPVPVLGTSFNVYAPLVLVVLCLFTFCKVSTVRAVPRALRPRGADSEGDRCPKAHVSRLL